MRDVRMKRWTRLAFARLSRLMYPHDIAPGSPLRHLLRAARRTRARLSDIFADYRNVLDVYAGARDTYPLAGFPLRCPVAHGGQAVPTMSPLHLLPISVMLPLAAETPPTIASLPPRRRTFSTVYALFGLATPADGPTPAYRTTRACLR